MKVDNTIGNIILEVSEEQKIDKEKVLVIVNGLWKTVRYIIIQTPASIKIDYFGKFIYSSAWKRKKEQIREEQLAKEKELNETNTTQSRD